MLKQVGYEVFSLLLVRQLLKDILLLVRRVAIADISP